MALVCSDQKLRDFLLAQSPVWLTERLLSAAAGARVTRATDPKPPIATFQVPDRLAAEGISYTLAPDPGNDIRFMVVVPSRPD